MSGRVEQRKPLQMGNPTQMGMSSHARESPQGHPAQLAAGAWTGTVQRWVVRHFESLSFSFLLSAPPGNRSGEPLPWRTMEVRSMKSFCHDGKMGDLRECELTIGRPWATVEVLPNRLLICRKKLFGKHGSENTVLASLTWKSAVGEKCHHVARGHFWTCCMKSFCHDGNVTLLKSPAISVWSPWAKIQKMVSDRP
jgi:hypothetical protein